MAHMSWPILAALADPKASDTTWVAFLQAVMERYGWGGLCLIAVLVALYLLREPLVARLLPSAEQRDIERLEKENSRLRRQLRETQTEDPDTEEEQTQSERGGHAQALPPDHQGGESREDAPRSQAPRGDVRHRSQTNGGAHRPPHGRSAESTADFGIGASTGIRGCYLRQDRFDRHLPLSRAASLVRLLGGSLCKYAAEISELRVDSSRHIRMILPDPTDVELLDRWIAVIADTGYSYCQDVLSTLSAVERRYQELNIDLRQTRRIPLATLTALDDVDLVIEYGFYKLPTPDRIVLEMDPKSVVGQSYISRFDELFALSEPLARAEDYTQAKTAWNALAKRHAPRI